MGTIIKGADFSKWRTIGIVIGQCANANNQGIKSNYAIFTIEDMDGGKPKREFQFEDEIFPGAIQLLSKYRELDAQGQPLKDEKGGFIINMKALKESADAERFQNKLVWNGGVMEWYSFQKGMCYGNDRNGKPSTYKDGTAITADGVNVFCQVKMYIVDSNGGMVPSYLPGMGPKDRGPRLERQFWKNAVNAAASAANTNQPPVTPPATSPAPTVDNSADPF